MDQIAAAAGVNKALLYYHFDSKENLYIAAVEMISAKIRDRSMAVFLRDASPGERLLQCRRWITSIAFLRRANFRA